MTTRIAIDHKLILSITNYYSTIHIPPIKWACLGWGHVEKDFGCTFIDGAGPNMLEFSNDADATSFILKYL